MAIRRNGKPYIWVTWLSVIQGGRRCLYSPWFKAHFKYDKHEEMASDLSRWSADHDRMMEARVRELQREGYTVSVENENSFKLEGETAVVAGKPDIVAVKAGEVLVVDGKTGRKKDADIHQVRFYLYALPKSRPDIGRDLVGEVQYKDGDRISFTTDDLGDEWIAQMAALVKTIASDTPPPTAPSRDECMRCNIGPKDCRDRITEEKEPRTLVGKF